MSDLEANVTSDACDTNRSKKTRQKDNGEEVKSKRRSSSSDSSSRSRSRSRGHSHRKSESRKHRHHRSRSPRSHSHRHHHHKSKHRRSRSRERSHRERPSHKRHHGSPHRSKGHKRSRSPGKRRSPRHKHNSRSPQHSKSNRQSNGSASPDTLLGAMAAQERLAQRMDKAKMRQRVKERRGNTWNGGRNNMTSEEKEKKYEEQKKQAKEMLEKAGVNIPSYYNPFAVNPMQIAKQTEKRKKLWSKKEDPKTDVAPTKTATTTGAMWSKMNFGDSKSNEKFAKLMGIKNPEELAKKLEGDSAASELIKKQEDVFKNLDQQYTQARITTHTQRGIGLGFTTNFVDPNTVPQPLVGSSNIPTTQP